VSFLASPNLTDPVADVAYSRDQGDSVTFSCRAKGYPQPVITWSTGASESRNISESTNTDAQGYLVITSMLTLSRLQREDNGIYTCTAYNFEGIDHRNFNLTVFCKLDFQWYIIGTLKC